MWALEFFIPGSQCSRAARMIGGVHTHTDAQEFAFRGGTSKSWAALALRPRLGLSVSAAPGSRSGQPPGMLGTALSLRWVPAARVLPCAGALSS